MVPRCAGRGHPQMQANEDILRLRDRRRRFGRVRARRAAVRGPVGVGLPARGRQARFEPADPHAARASRVLVPRRIHNWAFKTTPQPGLGGRRGYQPRGKTLGGSSSINAMVYTRGHRSDYDEWAALGNAGLVVRRSAAVFPPVREQRADRRCVPRAGRSAQRRRSALAERLHRSCGCAAAEAAGTPAQRGLQRRRAGRYRSLPADAEERRALERRSARILTPNLGRSNLSVRDERAGDADPRSRAARAVGVEYRRGGATRTVRARREVILSAGALQSPQLLLLSGIGDRRRCSAMGIPVVAARARRRPQPARPRRFRHRLPVARTRT